MRRPCLPRSPSPSRPASPQRVALLFGDHGMIMAIRVLDGATFEASVGGRDRVGGERLAARRTHGSDGHCASLRGATTPLCRADALVLAARASPTETPRRRQARTTEPFPLDVSLVELAARCMRGRLSSPRASIPLLAPLCRPSDCRLHEHCAEARLPPPLMERGARRRCSSTPPAFVRREPPSPRAMYLRRLNLPRGGPRFVARLRAATHRVGPRDSHQQRRPHPSRAVRPSTEIIDS